MNVCSPLTIEITLDFWNKLSMSPESENESLLLCAVEKKNTLLCLSKIKRLRLGHHTHDEILVDRLANT